MISVAWTHKRLPCGFVGEKDMQQVMLAISPLFKFIMSKAFFFVVRAPFGFLYILQSFIT